MSGYLKVNSNLFLEVAEQKRNDQFLDEWGYRRHVLANSKEYGIVKDLDLPELGTILTQDAFYVSKFGVSCYDKVIINTGMIIDQLGRFVVNDAIVDVPISPDSLWYWIKVKHKYKTTEIGTVSVDTFGNVTGVGTEFLNVLRGQPNFPSKIRFTNSVNGNADDYEVVDIISDNSCIIQGDFIAESDMTYSIVGTFTPGYPVPTADEQIFQYDYFEYELVTETILNTPPAFIAGEEFYLSRVKSNGTTIIIEDKRLDWWKPWGEWHVHDVNRNFNNNLIGVEGVQWEQPNSPRANNLVMVAWGMRFASYTIDPSLKKISVLIGNGGTFKDTSFFNSGDFTDWRLYSKDGSWRTIIDSTKTGTQIVLTLDVLDPDDYGMADQLFIAPPYESIEIRAQRDGANIDVGDQDNDTDTTEVFPWPNIERTFDYSINTPLVRMELPTMDGCYKYNLMYRYKTFKDYTDWQVFPDDPIGHYDEESYDAFGNLKLPIDRTQVPYAGDASLGFIKVCEAPDSFQNFQEAVDTGDLFGVNTTALDNSVPVVELQVGVDKQYQHYQGGLTLTADMFIHLRTEDDDGLPFREGNSFTLHIDQWVDLSTFRLRIVENYIDPTNFDLLAELNENDVYYARNNTSSDPGQQHRYGLFITCTFSDLGSWIVRWDTETCPMHTVRLVGPGVSQNVFNTSGDGIKHGYHGWRILNGNNGTLNMAGQFPRGTNSAGLIGASGGSNTVSIPVSALPNHTHTFSGTTNNDGAHSHAVWAGNGAGGGGFDKGEDDDARFYAHPDNSTTSRHQHNFSGTTDAGGGTGSPSPVDIVPPYLQFIYIQKFV